MWSACWASMSPVLPDLTTDRASSIEDVVDEALCSLVQIAQRYQLTTGYSKLKEVCLVYRFCCMEPLIVEAVAL